MAKPKEKKKEPHTNRIIAIVTLLLIVLISSGVATITTQRLMLPDTIRPEPCTNCCSDICDCKNDVMVSVVLTPIYYTIHCSIEHSEGITYLYMSNHTGQPSMMFAQGEVQHKIIEDKENIYSITKPYLCHNTQFYDTIFFEHHIEKMLEIHDKDPHEIRLMCDATPERDYKFNYTVWDEGYHETRELIIHPPEYSIDCITTSHRCQDKCTIIDTCILIHDGGSIPEDVFERELNDQIWNAIEEDIRRR